MRGWIVLVALDSKLTPMGQDPPLHFHGDLLSFLSLVCRRQEYMT
jgi:hypothetical protein